MKLNHWSLSGVAVLAVVALGSGCSNATPAPAHAATITSADAFSSSAPKVGRAHYVVDEEVGSGADEMTGATTSANELGAPKEPRRSDQKRRGGGFGSSK